jgi:hypothetical protein
MVLVREVHDLVRGRHGFGHGKGWSIQRKAWFKSWKGMVYSE